VADLEKITKKRLGEILLAEGVIQADQLQRALLKQQQTGELLGEALVKEGVTTETDIAKTLCAQFGKPFLKPTKYDIAKEVLALLPPKLMAEHNFVPIDRFGNLLVLAMGGLLDASTVAQIQKLTNCEIDVYVSTASDVRQALRAAFPDLYDPISLAPKHDVTGQMTQGGRGPVSALKDGGTLGFRPDGTQGIRPDATLGMRPDSTQGFRSQSAPKRPTPVPDPRLGAGGRQPEKSDTQRRFPEVPDTRKIESINTTQDLSVTSSQLGMTTSEFKSLRAEDDSDWDALFQEAEENVMRRLEADGGPNNGPTPKKK